jgi:putative transposase
MSRAQRLDMVDRQHPKLSLVRQCSLPRFHRGRSSLYYRPAEAGAEDLELMALMDRQYLKTPFYGSRKMTAWLRAQGYQVNRKRVRRLMQVMGLQAIYRRPNTSKPAPDHKVYPYLLKGLEINRVNQVWSAACEKRWTGAAGERWSIPSRWPWSPNLSPSATISTRPDSNSRVATLGR